MRYFVYGVEWNYGWPRRLLIELVQELVAFKSEVGSKVKNKYNL